MLYLPTFFSLIKRDITVFTYNFHDRVINSLIWCAFTQIVFHYIMPYVGLKDYGVFMAVSSAATVGFFDSMIAGSKFIADLEGNQSIYYYLTLPMPQWMVIFRTALSNAFQTFFVSFLFFPITKLMLWNSFDISPLFTFKFLLFFVVLQLFYGCVSLVLIAWTKSLDSIENVWMRVLYPLWWLGCYQFSWQTLYAINPTLAKIDLLNPLVYAVEGMRAVFFGQEGSLPYWYCVAALTGFSIIVGLCGVRMLMRRLHCV